MPRLLLYHFGFNIIYIFSIKKKKTGRRGEDEELGRVSMETPLAISS